MKNDLNKCCAFTGHRPAKFPWKYDEKDSRCIELKSVLAQQINNLAAAGVTNFFSGMALGTDYEKKKIMRSEILEAAPESSR